MDNREENNIDEAAENIIEDWLFNAPFPNILDIFSSDSSSSSSDFSSDDENDPRVPRTCIRNFVDNTVHLYTDEEFRRHFRLLRVTAYYLIHRFEGTDFFNNVPLFGEGISHERAMLMTLWYLANTETFRQIADRFDLACSTAHRLLICCLNFIISLAGEFIEWPATAEEKEVISKKFANIQNIHGIIGSIDGCHVRITRPTRHQADYFNRTRYHSVLLQGVVNSDKMFIDVYIGEPGSMHDARVLRRSPLYRLVTEDPQFFGNYFLIRDSAYPNRHCLLPPFRDNGHLTADQRRFNYKHSATRVVVEQAFGLLRARFRRLFRFDNLRLDIIIKCIMSACILHNICIVQNNDDPDDYFTDDTKSNSTRSSNDTSSHDEVGDANDNNCE